MVPKKHLQRKFIPHATIIYDDVDPAMFRIAEKLISKDKLMKKVVVKEVLLLKNADTQQESFKKFDLNIA